MTRPKQCGLRPNIALPCQQTRYLAGSELSPRAKMLSNRRPPLPYHCAQRYRDARMAPIMDWILQQQPPGTQAVGLGAQWTLTGNQAAWAVFFPRPRCLLCLAS
jgi:hypothetical protein